MTCVGHVEIDPFCWKVLRKHWPQVPLIGDVKEVQGDEFGAVELICGGPPCQPVSLAGKRQGQSDDRWLWGEALRLVEVVRPPWCLFENPPGIVSLGLDRILADLEGLGYSARTFEIPACAVDAPHIRQRVWIVAHARRERRQQKAGSTSQNEGAHGWGQESNYIASSDGPNHLAHPNGGYASTERVTTQRETRTAAGQQPQDDGTGQLAHAEGERRQPGPADNGLDCQRVESRGGKPVQPPLGGEDVSDLADRNGEHRRPGAEGKNGAQAGDSSDGWTQYEWIECTDGKARRVKPGVRLLAHRVPGRVARLRALGNAVVPQVVERIGRALMEVERR